MREEGNDWHADAHLTLGCKYRLVAAKAYLLARRFSTAASTRSGLAWTQLVASTNGTCKHSRKSSISTSGVALLAASFHKCNAAGIAPADLRCATGAGRRQLPCCSCNCRAPHLRMARAEQQQGDSGDASGTQLTQRRRHSIKDRQLTIADAPPACTVRNPVLLRPQVQQVVFVLAGTHAAQALLHAAGRGRGGVPSGATQRQSSAFLLSVGLRAIHRVGAPAQSVLQLCCWLHRCQGRKY